MSGPDEQLADYLGASFMREVERVGAALTGMNPRERALVLEAAIIGYVRGFGAGQVTPYPGRVPDDQAIILDVVGAAIRNPGGNYPQFERAENRGWRQHRQRATTTGETDA